MKKPVLLLTFNRLEYLKAVFNAVAQYKPDRLYIASDGAREEKAGEKELIKTIRQWMLQNVSWKCEVKTRFLNQNSGGCAKGVYGAVSWFFENEKDGIILEDDCVPNPSFFSFCEDLLERYKDNKQVWHIAGDAPIPVKIPESYYFSKIEHCWGWASWADRWKNFSLDMDYFPESALKNFSNKTNVQTYWRDILHRLKNHQIDSWAYPWIFYIVFHKGLCITPTKCLISNIGITGVHYKNSQNPELNRKTYFLEKIIHPKKVAFNEPLIQRIYEEKFGIRKFKEVCCYFLFGFIPLLKIEVK